ncbi:TetR/AcrR family transcriptional regulator [Actinomycetospora chlora]|uniref:TetR/AcrR family transcriptional regulator n=1 Tax=Actinomycetospora chlora TaxID=663608 RepID=A0ABP9A5C6_9PSEU
MATARTPRRAWVEAGLQALGVGGPDAVRVESLARTLGVTKGGFYGFFADRAALLTEVLDLWEQRTIADTLEQVECEGGDAVTRSRRAAELTFAPELLPVDLAVRDWARREPAVAERLQRVDDQRMEYLRSQFRERFPDPDELEARCLLAFSAAIAAGLIAVEHPRGSRAEVLGRATRLLFAGPSPERELRSPDGGRA